MPKLFHSVNAREAIASRVIAGGCARILFAIFLVSCALPLPAEEPFSPVPAMPGRQVSVGTHKLHIYCEGTGRPTVVIDSGLGGFSLEWKKVQAGVAEDTQICTYDRAGYGWSQPGPEPRTTDRIVNELHALLINAEIPPPYILVGHSFGGYTARYFASMYPESVAGLVLIDASHPDQFRRLPQPEVRHENKPAKGSTVRLSMPVISDNYPEEAKRQAFILMVNQRAIHTYDQEWENFQTSAQQVSAMDHLPDVPLTVITRGKRVWPHNAFGDASEQVWFELQDELAELTNQSLHLIASRSGHLVHLDEPKLVISAVTKTAETARRNEEIRLARLRQQNKITRQAMLLVSINHLRSSNNRYVNPLYGIHTQARDIHHASFLMPY